MGPIGRETSDEEDARRVLVVEDDSLTGLLLADLLRAHGFLVEVVPSAGTARAALDEFDPDIALLDIALGEGPNGIAVGHLIAREYPATAVVFLTRFADQDATGVFGEDLPAGCGFVRKDRVGDTGYLLAAIDGVLADRADSFRQDLAPDHPLAVLTKQQRQVLHMVAQGLTNTAIARRRGTSTSAVEQIVAGIFRALGLQSGGDVSPRMEAARLYITAVGMPDAP